MRPDDVSNNVLWILDRRHPDVGGVLWTLQQVPFQHVNSDYARWLASAGRGRFIVCEHPFGATIEGGFAFFDDEGARFSFVAHSFAPFPRDQRHLHFLVEPRLFSRFEASLRARDERIAALQRQINTHPKFR